jgi:aryl-alcohol dehydrogenase-like predicted oxidoreductase
MTFGRAEWGCDESTARQILCRYVESGGNFIDTADIYGSGASEKIIGKFIAQHGRDRLVVATKYSLASRAADDPNGSGNGRKNMLRALDGSLRRLGADYVDLYYLHAWDAITSPEEVMRGLDDLVSQGKVRYVALSDVPAWYAARAQSLAQWRGCEAVCALQMEYSLLERGIENEFPSRCAELGMSLVTWSPLANGLLTDKYLARAAGGELPSGRVRATASTMPAALRRDDPRTWDIVRALGEVAEQVGRTSAQVAVNWVTGRPGVASVILGATSEHQLEDTLRSLEFRLPDAALERLDGASALGQSAPYTLLRVQQAVMNKGVSHDE